MTPTTRTVDSDSASVARADGGADRVESETRRGPVRANGNRPSSPGSILETNGG